jgi:hypothetical protein
MVVEIYPEFSKPEDKISPNSYDGTMSGRAGPKKLIPVKEQNKSQAFMEIPLFGGLSEHLCAAERVALQHAHLVNHCGFGALVVRDTIISRSPLWLQPRPSLVISKLHTGVTTVT